LWKKRELILTNNKIINVVGFFFFFATFLLGLYYLKFGILPPSVFHNHSYDLFMDFFNTNANAYSPGRYTGWHSLYPPLSFIVGQIVTPNECADSIEVVKYNSLWLRNCAINSYFYFVIPVYLISVYYTYKLNLIFLDKNKLTLYSKFSLICILAFNMPLLFLVERGNYLILAYLFFLLFIYHNNNTFKTILGGLLVNLKPYLIVFFGYEFIKKNYLSFFYYLASVLFFFGVTFYFLSDDFALLFVKNMFSFSGSGSINIHALNFTNSFETYVNFVHKLYKIDLSHLFNVFRLIVITLFIYFIFNRNYDKFKYMLVSILCMLVLTASVGFYFYVFLLPFILYFLRLNFYLFIGVIYIIIPFDLVLITKDLTMGPVFNSLDPSQIKDTPYISSMTHQFIILSLGFFIKPFITFLIFIFLIFEGNLNEQKKY
jgi:hypothetical protein